MSRTESPTAGMEGVGAPSGAGIHPEQPPAPADPGGVTATPDPAGATATPDPAGATATPDPAGATATPDPAGATATPAPAAARRNLTAAQVLSGLLIMGVCLAGAVWYVPRIISTNQRSFTGTVSGNGITNLNFAGPGLVGDVHVHLGQVVKTGQVLATETSPATIASLSADRASIAAAQATVAELHASPVTPTTAASIAAAGAQLAKGQAQLAADQVKLSETQIVAPSSGTVIAINGQRGEAATPAGIRSYSSQQQAPSAQSPPFSLLPEGPTTSLKTTPAQSALPMIALRSSTSWQVQVLVPQSSVADVRSGLKASISVPAVGLRGIAGYVEQISPTPVSTSGGTAYQVVISIRGHQQATPLSGMTANVQLGL